MLGHTVHGTIIRFVKEGWLNETGQFNHDHEFNYRLYKECYIAHKNRKEFEKKLKTWYEKKVRERPFKEGDKALVLPPIPSESLRAQFCGPYTIDKKVGDSVYICVHQIGGTIR